MTRGSYNLWKNKQGEGLEVNLSETEYMSIDDAENET